MPVNRSVSSSPCAQTELLERGARRREHRAGDVEPAAQRLEHRLAAHRRGLDRRRRGGDAQQAHDVEAAAARARHRARTPQRGVRRGAEDRGHPATVVGRAGPRRARGRAPARRRRPGRAARAARARTWWALASPAPSPSAVERRRRAWAASASASTRPSGSVSPTSWARKQSAQAAELRVGTGRVAELLDQRRAGRDVARGEQRTRTPSASSPGARVTIRLGQQRERTARERARRRRGRRAPSARSRRDRRAARRPGRRAGRSSSSTVPSSVR